MHMLKVRRICHGQGLPTIGRCGRLARAGGGRVGGVRGLTDTRCLGWVRRRPTTSDGAPSSG